MPNVRIKFGPTRCADGSPAVRGPVDNSSWQALLHSCGQLGGVDCTDVLLVDPTDGDRLPLKGADLATIVERAELFGVVQAAAAPVSTSSNTALMEQLQKLQEVAGSLQQSMQLTQSMCQLILYDHLGPTSSSSSTKGHNADYRAKAIHFYHPDCAVKPTQLRCMLTNMELNSDEVIAAHIYRAGWSRAFRTVMGLDINDPSNLLLLVRAAERKFDQFQWTLKPLPPKTILEGGVDRFMQPYKVLVLNPQLLQGREQLIADHLQCRIKWADVQGRELLFGAGEDEPKPLRRACGLHAMLAIQYAKQQGWLKEDMDCLSLCSEDLTVDDAAWASPTFDRARMDAFLADLPNLASDELVGVIEAL